MQLLSQYMKLYYTVEIPSGFSAGSELSNCDEKGKKINQIDYSTNEKTYS
jgi:hypothetical protein